MTGRERIESLTVQYKDGRTQTFEGKGSINVYKTKQKQRRGEGFPENREFFVEIAHVWLHLGETTPPPKA